MRRVHDHSNLERSGADASNCCQFRDGCLSRRRGHWEGAGSIQLPIVEDHLGVALIQPGRRRYRHMESKKSFVAILAITMNCGNDS